jgi:hypothetical protein
MVAGCWWLTSIILATQEAEMRRTEVQSQSRQVVPRDTTSKKTLHTQKKRADGVTQGTGPEFKFQYHTHKKIKNHLHGEARLEKHSRDTQ